MDRASGGAVVKQPPACAPRGHTETGVLSLGPEDPLEEERHGNLLQSSCLKSPTDRGAAGCYSPEVRKELDTPATHST